MKFIIKHEIKGADKDSYGLLSYDLSGSGYASLLFANLPNVKDAKVYDRTARCCHCIFRGRDADSGFCKKFHYEDVAVPSHLLDHSKHEILMIFIKKTDTKNCTSSLRKWFVPSPGKTVVTSLKTPPLSLQKE